MRRGGVCTMVGKRQADSAEVNWGTINLCGSTGRSGRYLRDSSLVYQQYAAYLVHL